MSDESIEQKVKFEHTLVPGSVDAAGAVGKTILSVHSTPFGEAIIIGFTDGTHMAVVAVDTEAGAKVEVRRLRIGDILDKGMISSGIVTEEWLKSSKQADTTRYSEFLSDYVEMFREPKF